MQESSEDDIKELWAAIEDLNKSQEEDVQAFKKIKELVDTHIAPNPDMADVVAQTHAVIEKRMQNESLSEEDDDEEDDDDDEDDE